MINLPTTRDAIR